MPSLDVTEVLYDPDLCDAFQVRRVQEVVGPNGRVSKVPTMFPQPGEPDLLGVISWDTKRTKRRDDSAMNEEELEIVTQFSLRAASFGWQPDVVIWRGAEYTVMRARPYRHFGAGFTSASCVSTRAMDRAPPAI